MKKLFISILIISMSITTAYSQFLTLFDFDYLGTPSCNPFKDDPNNFFPDLWKVSHGTPSISDSYGQGFYNLLKLRATRLSDDFYQEKSEGLFISYPFQSSHSYDIIIHMIDGSGGDTGIDVFAANNVTESSNNNCTEDIIPTVADKQEIYTSNYVGYFHTIEVTNWSPNKNYSHFWLLSRQFYNEGSFYISQIIIDDNGLKNPPPPDPTPCEDYVVILDNVLAGASDNREAGQMITAANTISNNGAAIYHAGQEVALYPNFHAQNGSTFHAYVEGCSGDFQARSQDEIGNDKNGKEQDYPTDTDEINNSSKLVVYPNPAKDELNIVLPTERELLEATFYDIQGRAVLTTTNTIIPITELLAGVYFVNIQLTNGERITKKVIVSRD